MDLRWPPWCEQSSLNSRSNAHCDGAAMAPLCKLVKRGAVRANDLPLSNDLEAWPDSSVGRAPTYKVRGRKFESRSGRLFSRTFTLHFVNTTGSIDVGRADLNLLSTDGIKDPIDVAITKYSLQPSVKRIKDNFNPSRMFEFALVSKKKYTNN